MKLVTRKLKSLKPAPWNPRETLQPGEHEIDNSRLLMNGGGNELP